MEVASRLVGDLDTPVCDRWVWLACRGAMGRVDLGVGWRVRVVRSVSTDEGNKLGFIQSRDPALESLGALSEIVRGDVPELGGVII